MKVKVIHDGTMFGTKVVNAATGENVEGVYKAEIVFEIGNKPSLVLYCRNFETDIAEEAEVK